MAQTWRTMTSGYWSDALNWGGTLPANDGTADLLFAQIGDPIKSHGFTTMDINWNVHSITWNSTSLDQGQTYINVPTPTQTVLTLQAGFSNVSGGIAHIYPDVAIP